MDEQVPDCDPKALEALDETRCAVAVVAMENIVEGQAPSARADLAKAFSGKMTLSFPVYGIPVHFLI